MKIIINKKISQIHWSAALAAVMFFIISAHVYKEYNEEKFLIEQGIVLPAIVIKKIGGCSEHSRSGNYVRVNIQVQNREADLRINYRTCIKTHLGDTITVYCSDSFDRIITFDPAMAKPRGLGLYLSIFGFVISIALLVFKYKEK